MAKLTAAQSRAIFLATVKWIKENFKQKNKIIGLDISYSSTGFVVLNKDTGEPTCSGSFGTTTADGNYALRNEKMYRNFVELFQEHKPDIIAIEAITVFTNPAAAKTLIFAEAMMLKAFIDVCPKAKIVAFTTTQVKKIATGVGKAGKKDIGQAIQERWGYSFQTDDEADAFSAAIGAYNLYKFASEVINYIGPEEAPAKIMNVSKGRHLFPYQHLNEIKDVLVSFCTSEKKYNIVRMHDFELFKSLLKDVKLND